MAQSSKAYSLMYNNIHYDALTFKKIKFSAVECTMRIRVRFMAKTDVIQCRVR